MAQPTYQTQPTSSPLWASEPFRVFFPLGSAAAAVGPMASSFAIRASADMKASLIVSHHIYAALLWAGVVIAWAISLAPLWRSSPPPET